MMKIVHQKTLHNTSSDCKYQFNKKAVLSQRWQRDAPYVWVPWKMSRVSEYANGYYSRNF